MLDSKKLFLLDGFGALLSAFLLGVILVQFESAFGMPRKVLYGLSFAPCVFAVYDFICYFKIKENWRTFLKIIAYANLLYLCASIGLLIHHYPKLTGLGVSYFLLEFVVVLIVVWLELKTVRRTDTAGKAN